MSADPTISGTEPSIARPPTSAARVLDPITLGTAGAATYSTMVSLDTMVSVVMFTRWFTAIPSSNGSDFVRSLDSVARRVPARLIDWGL